MQIESMAYHRNGVSGMPFVAVIFTDPETAPGRFLATVFRDQPGCCSVINLDLIAEHGVQFGHNSWRGDRFEGPLYKAIKAAGLFE